MAEAAKLAGYRYPLQIALIVTTTTAFVFFTDAFAFRSPINLAWMIGLPIIVAFFGNIDWGRRCFMAMALTGVSLVTMIVVGVNFTSYS